MLIEFRVANFRSFKEEQVLSLVAGRGRSHPENLIPADNERLLKAAALYGANASGKSNLVKALMVMRDFVLGSATKMNQGDLIEGITPFRLDEESSSQPSRFEIKVIVEGTRYEYGFSASVEEVCDEWLFARAATGNRRLLFERTCQTTGGKESWRFGPSLKKDAPLLQEKTRNNGLALSRGADLNISALSEVFLWFRNGLLVFDLSRPPLGLIWKTTVAMKKDRHLQERIAKLVRQADLGITSISLAEKAPSFDMPEEIRNMFKEDVLRKIIESRTAAVEYSAHTRHMIGGVGKEVEFDLESDESNGTQRLFALAGPLFDALDHGTTVVVDELECSMHPLLSRKLIELFQSAELNTKGAQLIFATHDVTLMDPVLFRRDQLWLVEKNAVGASLLYSLDDFEGKSRPRSTEAFFRRYLAGRYGGVPSFGPAIEDLDFKTSDSEDNGR